jgi:hypothetical protein
MAESIKDRGTGPKWHWHAVMKDLREQGGLDGVVIDPLSVGANSCGGDFNGNSFLISWVYGEFMMLSMQNYSQELVNAFAKVLEYEPFCRYDEGGVVPTVEWDKGNSDRRFAELTAGGKPNLQRFQLVT